MRILRRYTYLVLNKVVSFWLTSAERSPTVLRGYPTGDRPITVGVPKFHKLYEAVLHST